MFLNVLHSKSEFMQNNRFLNACLKKPVDCTPVWIMRQAGRYLKEYMAIREKMPFIEMCKTPDIAAEVTLQPLRIINLDAAIIFADILLPLEKMGIGFEFSKEEGPVIYDPIRTERQINKLRVIEPEEDVRYVLEAIRLVRKELGNKVPLIGFSGAPFTLASYVIEGGHSQNYLLTKKMMISEPALWRKLMDRLSAVVIKYLLAQIAAGAQVVQIFDSWVGCLSPVDYSNFVLPYMKKIMRALKKGRVPVINFATDTSGVLGLMREAGGDVIGVDWRIDLDAAWKRLGYTVGIQGNLDPAILFAKPEAIKKRVRDILKKANGRRGHIFNLGHGVLPGTPVDNVKALVDMVHSLSAR